MNARSAARPVGIAARRSGARWPATLRLVWFALLAHLLVLGGYVLLSLFFGGFQAAICQWDCNWYGSIIEKGYSRGADAAGYANWAFFPLFPLLGGVVSRLSGLHFILSLEVVNAAAFLMLILASARYARLRFGLSDGPFLVFLFVSFPFGLYYRAPYSEAVYGLLVVLTLTWFGTGRWLAAGLCAALVCTCRPTGIFLVTAIGICHLVEAARALHRADRLGAWRRLMQGCGFVMLGCSGLLAYMLYLQLHTGDALAFSHVQKAWNRTFGNPVSRLLMGLSTPDLHMRHFLTVRSNSGRYLALCGVAGLGLAVVALVRRRLAEGLFLLMTLLVSTATSLEALPRIMLCNPVSIVLVGCLLERAAPPVRWGILSLFLALQTLLVLSWYHGWAFLT